MTSLDTRDQAIIRGDSRHALAIAILNQKGGVGKTTTTINLAATLAARKKRVLVIDVDPQGTATTATIGKANDGTAEILGYGSAEDVSQIVDALVRRSDAYGIDVIGADFDRLNHQEIALTSSPMLMVRFVELIEAVEDRYDFVLFDCPPALRSLTTATIYAADHVVVVVEPSKESIDGLGKLIRYLAGLTKLLQREPSVAGAIITKADPREILVRDVRAGLEETGRFPWIQSIYLTVGFKDAYTESKPLAAIAKSRAHQLAIDDLEALANRVIELVPVVPT
jgi:chromosome partitioning protein